MASGPITSWQIDGETVETVAGFIFLGSKITADGDCSHEIKRHLLLGRKVMTNLDSILKSKDITLSTKVHLFKAMVFPVVMYGCESWTWALKNWCFWTVVLEKTLESPLDGKEIQPVHHKGDQSWVFIGRTDVEAETPILWQPDVKSWLFWKDPDAGKDWGQEEKGWQRMRWLDGITDSMDMVWVDSGSWWRTGRPGMLWFMGLPRLDMIERLNWTELNYIVICICQSRSPNSLFPLSSLVTVNLFFTSVTQGT